MFKRPAGGDESNTLLRELKAASCSFTRSNYKYSSPGRYAVIGWEKNNANEGCNSVVQVLQDLFHYSCLL